MAADELSNGDNPVGTISTTDDVDSWTFSADCGDAIRVQIAELSGSSFNPFIRLYNPDGELVASNSGTYSAGISHQAEIRGTYTVNVLDGSSTLDGTGTYQLFLSKIPGDFIVPSGDEGGALTNGGVHTGTIEVADMDMWTFSADASDTVTLQVSETSGSGFNPIILLYGPGGSLIDSNAGSASANVVEELTVAGTYTVMIRDNTTDVTGSGDYKLYFARVPGDYEVPEGDEGGALTNGGVHTGTIEVADMDMWTFSADALDTVTLQVSETSGSGFNPIILLYGPGGSLIDSNAGSASANVVEELTVAGTYTVMIRDNTTDVTGSGDYKLYFARVPGDYEVPEGDEGGALTNGGVHTGTIEVADMDMWTFSADALDTVTLQVSETSGSGFNPIILLYGPGGSLIDSNAGSASANVVEELTVAGTYTVMIRDNTTDVTGSGDYKLYFARVPGDYEVPEGDEGGALTNGGVHTGTIEVADMDMWTFSADALDTVTLQVSETSGSGFNPIILLYGPGGSLIDSNAGSASANVVEELTVAGTYTVMIRDNTTDVTGSGDYKLYFARVPGDYEVPEGDEGGALTNGGVHTGTIEVADMDMWTFSADALDTVTLQVSETDGSGFNPIILLYGPGGSLIESNSGSASANVVEQLTVAGTYTVVVRDSTIDVTGSGDYELTYSLAEETTTIPSGSDIGSISNGGLVSGYLSASEVNKFSLSVNAGEKIRLRLTDMTGSSADYLTFQLFGADGSLISTDTSYGVAQITYTSESTETLTGVIFNSAEREVYYDLYTAIVPRSYTIPDGDEGGALSNGTVASGLITHGDIDFYSLSVVAGEKIRLRLTDMTGSSADYLTLQLFRADGSLISTDTSYGVAQITYIAESTETLTAIIFNSVKNEVDYDLYTAIVPRSYTVPDGDEGGALSNGTVASGLITHGDIDFYSLSVVAGEKIRLRLTDMTGSSSDTLTLKLFGSDGSLISTDTSYGVAQITYIAESTESLTAIIFNSAKYEVDYDLYTAIVPRSYTVPDGDEGGALSNGTVASGLITHGDIDFYSLSVVAGEKIRLRLTDMTGSSSDTLTLKLFGSDGSLISTDTSYGVAQITYIAESTESLTAIIFNSAKYEVDYDLYTAIVPRSYTVPDGDEGGALSNGTVASGLITHGDIDFYSLSVVAGEKIRLRLTDMTGSSSDTLTLKLFGSDGSLISTDTSYGVAQITYIAESTETLTAIIFNSSKNEVDYDLYTAIVPRSYAVPDGDEGGALTDSVAVSGVLVSGDIDLYTMSVTAGNVVSVSVTDNTGSSSDTLTLQLFGSDGSLISTATSYGVAQITYTTENTENLTAIIFNSSTNEANYEIVVNGINEHDTDGDGIPDDWEEANGLNPSNPDDASYDTDNDGLNNVGEYQNETDPNNPDSDGDTLPDGWEVEYGLDPMDDGSTDEVNGCDGDPDGDGLTNCEEYQYGLNPLEEEKGEVALDPSELTVSIGGSVEYQVTVANTTVEPDTFTLTLTGLDADWTTFEETAFVLLAGEEKTVRLAIDIPEDCGIAAEDYPFTVTVTPSSGVLTGSTTATLTVTVDPILANILPEDGETVGTNSLPISWTSDAPGSTEVFYRQAGETAFTALTGEDGVRHSVTVSGLSWDTSYEWYVQTATLCGATQSEVRTSTIAKGIAFEDEPYAFTIDRDYEQVASIQVRNTDTNPHEVMLSIINENEDLVAGFRGDGSQDQTITLQPDEVQTIEVAFHAQDAEDTEYTVTFVASADAESDHPILTYAEATITVNQPIFDLVLEEIDTNPQTLVNTYRLTNNGTVLTDVAVSADDDSRPYLLFEPAIEHYRMETGDSIEFTVLADKNVDATIIATGGEGLATLDTHFGCADGTTLYTVAIESPVICRHVSGWYCTNKPNIDVRYTLPQGMKMSDVNKAALVANFSYKAGWGYTTHDVHILMNENPILNLYDANPVGDYTTAFPPSFMNYSQDGAAANTIQVRTRHMNGGHYAVVSDFKVALELNEPIEVVVCASSEAEAEALALEKASHLICDQTFDVCPSVVDVQILDPETGEEKEEFYRGDQIEFDVQVLNPDSVEHVMTLQITMDDDPEDEVDGVSITLDITVPAYSYQTGQYITEAPDSLPDGQVYVSVTLADDACTTETSSVNSFQLGTPEGPTAWVTDGGIYATENTAIFAEWGAEDPNSFDISYYTYSVGSEPCLADVVDWTQAASPGEWNIPAGLDYDQTYYVCVKATNEYGAESETAAQTDGITILDPLGDPDEDGFTNDAELAAQSDPFNGYSVPGESEVSLSTGFNLVSFPAEVLFYQSIEELMAEMGGRDVISRVLIFDPDAQAYQEVGYDTAGNFYNNGSAISLSRGRSLDGMIVYTLQGHTAVFTSQYCGTWEVQSGINLTGTGCENALITTAFDLLSSIGQTDISISIQRYNTETGRFETATDPGDGQATGVNFTIQPGEGYFVHVSPNDQ
ncbi:hypothetical protein DSCO28_54010 [Desulfosarcina ovata subsp. sediminis]|uniref:Fibronectin type-III domain-containing protein n=1 Tax=Desulfosarcina ovata subsp. sediminis TaxID=885957 RepID=A0A5K7ZX47_9BACT|nr:hypothetical protein [Desulfosarcina ovata]BBO84835.1 hypothetical protein DSCO28_54010 [Desulfosarcina ovata subsp. sediminis]